MICTPMKAPGIPQIIAQKNTEKSTNMADMESALPAINGSI